MLRADVCHASEYARKSTNLRRDNMVINISSSLSQTIEFERLQAVKSTQSSSKQEQLET